MDTLLLLIALTTAGSVGLLTMHLYQRTTAHGRIVSQRIATASEGLAIDPGLILRRNHRRFPSIPGLPVSGEAAERMNLQLIRAGWSLRAHEYVSIRVGSVAIAIGVVLLVLRLMNVESALVRVVVPLVAAVIAWLIPRLALALSRKRRLGAIEQQLPDAMMAIVKSLRAGTGILQGLAYAAHETPAPLGPELQGAVRDLQLGAEGDAVFADLARRVGSPDLDIATTAIVIQRSVGGNLSEILAQVAETIRERRKLEGDIRVLTTQQRVSGYIAACLPVFVAGLSYLVRPDLAVHLFTTIPGLIALAVGIAFEVVGIFMMWQFAMVEV
jgi:tight adherence protein B